MRTASPAGRAAGSRGLPTGKLYTFSVTADNTTGGLPGTGVSPAGTSARTMISGLPGAPKVAGTAGDRSLRVHLTPGSTGGAAITSFRLTVDGRGTHRVVRPAASARWATVTGLYDGSTARTGSRWLR